MKTVKENTRNKYNDRN